MRTRDPLLRSRMLLLATQAGASVIRAEQAALDMALKEMEARRKAPTNAGTLADDLASGFEMEK